MSIIKKRASITLGSNPFRSNSPSMPRKLVKIKQRTFSPGKTMLSSIYSPRQQTEFKDWLKGKLKPKPSRAIKLGSSRIGPLPAIKASLSTKADSNYSSCERRHSPVNLRYHYLKLQDSHLLHSRADSPNVMQTPSTKGEDDSYLDNIFTNSLRTYYDEEIYNYGRIQHMSPIPKRQYLSEGTPHLSAPNRCESPIAKKELPTIFNLDEVPMKVENKCSYSKKSST